MMTGNLARHKVDWDDLAELDPLWSILTCAGTKYNRWDKEEFFRTGEEEIQSVIAKADRLGRPLSRARALDFGCGVGRLTRALTKHFDRCCGVDISEKMIVTARELNASFPSCEFLFNDRADLSAFLSDSFDLVYTARVLQHLPSRVHIKSCILELFRVVRAEGLLVFQLPSYIDLRRRLQPRRRLYRTLKRLGGDKLTLYQKMGLSPMRMSFIPEKDVASLLNSVGAQVLRVEADSLAGPIIQSRTYFATKTGKPVCAYGGVPEAKRADVLPGARGRGA